MIGFMFMVFVGFVGLYLRLSELMNVMEDIRDDISYIRIMIEN